MEVALWIVRPTVEYAYIPYWPHTAHFRHSDSLPFELRPGGRFRLNGPEFDTAVITNAEGLRGGPIDWRKPRVLCLGDSYTFGWGVENDETWCARLGQLFGGRYAFVNAAFAAGYSPDGYAVWLRRHRRALDPIAIVVQVSEYEFGIVRDHVWHFSATTRSDPVPDRVERPGYVVTSDGAWIRDGRVARIPAWLRHVLKASYTVAIVRDRIARDADDGRPAGTDLEARTKFLVALAMLWHEAGDRVVALYVVGDRSSSTVGPAETTVRAFAQGRGVPVLTNAGDFEARDYFRLDPHWTASGHEKVARFLHRELTTRGY
jgi:hypothetical protein